MIPKTATSRLFSVSRTFTTTAPRSTTATWVESRPILCRRNRARGAGSCCPYPRETGAERPPTSAATPASRSHGLCFIMDYPVRAGAKVPLAAGLSKAPGATSEPFAAPGGLAVWYEPRPERRLPTDLGRRRAHAGRHWAWCARGRARPPPVRQRPRHGSHLPPAVRNRSGERARHAERRTTGSDPHPLLCVKGRSHKRPGGASADRRRLRERAAGPAARRHQRLVPGGLWARAVERPVMSAVVARYAPTRYFAGRDRRPGSAASGPGPPLHGGARDRRRRHGPRVPGARTASAAPGGDQGHEPRSLHADLPRAVHPRSRGHLEAQPPQY